MLGARIANLKRWPLFIRLKDDAVNTQEMTSFDFTESKTRVIQMKTLISRFIALYAILCVDGGAVATAHSYISVYLFRYGKINV